MAAPQMMYPPPLESERGGAIHTTNGDAVDIDTPILIVGAGPVGMLHALLLARIHKQACTLIEREPTTTTYPKMEYTNGRSMEIYRAMGLHDEIRALATKLVPEHFDNTEVIVTGFGEEAKHVHTWERDSPEMQRRKSRLLNDGSQYLEPHMRCHQIEIERFLKDKVEAEELIQSYWGTAFVGLQESSDHVSIEAKKADGSVLRIRSQYVVGCDGGGSYVRKSAGLESLRSYLDLTMAFVHVRSSALRAMNPFPRFWHANVIGGGVVVSQNEDDVWTIHYTVPPGVDVATLSADDILALTVGGCGGPKPIPYEEMYCQGVWKVEVAIANAFRSDGGRIFLAGDAAHQLSPIGGHGLNSGTGDVFDLSWKLSAVLQGWAGQDLLSTYDAERRAIAFENLEHVQKGLGDVMPILTAHLQHGADVVNANDDAGRRARESMVPLCENSSWLHNQNGNILGCTYKQSPAILTGREDGKRPQGTDDVYVPTTYPGSRAPHVWMKDGNSTLDLLSTSSFNVVDFSADQALSQPLVQAAKKLGLSLKVLKWSGEDANVKAVYERDLVLIRPDMYVAWRAGNDSGAALDLEQAVDILRMVSGRGSVQNGNS